MRLATQEDVENALRRPLTEPEAEWIDPLLDEAGDVVRAYLHPWQIPTPPPGEIVRVVASLAASVINRPANVPADTKSLTADVYGITFATGSTGLGPYLSQGLRDRLQPFKDLAGNGMVVVGLASERGYSGDALDLSRLTAVTRGLGDVARRGVGG